MFTPVKNKKVYQLIVEQIQEMILAGELQAGDKLPSERDMAETFEASRSSIREAVRSLEILGIIESRQGEGNYIRGASGTQWLEPLSVMFKLNGGTFDEILEMRQILECEAARLAAERIDEDQKKALSSLVESIKGTQNEEERAKFDRAFHLLIAEASRNILITSVIGAINAILKNFIEEARESVNVWANDPGVLTAQHQKVCDAILKGDGDAAAKEMCIHFEFVVDSRKS